MAKKPYKGIKRKSLQKKSPAKLAHEARVKNMKSLSARSLSARKGKKKTDTSSKRKATHVLHVVPMKPIGTLVQQLPTTDISRKGMSLRALLRKTPRLFHHNAENVVIKKLTKKKTRTGLTAITGKVFSEDFSGAHRVVYDTYIIGLDKPGAPVNKQRRVLVSCNCQNYVYTWEYANAFNGCSKIVYGNGDAPDFTNPGKMPGLCKHLIAFSQEIIQKGL